MILTFTSPVMSGTPNWACRAAFSADSRKSSLPEVAFASITLPVAR
ncbi:MAG TPA: hypothetical protein VK400_03145 [Pyrinomonadaceae bacterium]|nr:hypothetical protein [Pyrinomonadaceae bacterium]